MAAIFNVSVQSDMDGNLAVVLTNVSGCQGVSSNKDVQSSQFFGRAFFFDTARRWSALLPWA